MQTASTNARVRTVNSARGGVVRGSVWSNVSVQTVNSHDDHMWSNLTFRERISNLWLNTERCIIDTIPVLIHIKIHDMLTNKNRCTNMSVLFYEYLKIGNINEHFSDFQQIIIF